MGQVRVKVRMCPLFQKRCLRGECELWDGGCLVTAGLLALLEVVHVLRGSGGEVPVRVESMGDGRSGVS